MHAVNSVFRWSLYASIIAAFMAAGIVIGLWAAIEVLSFLIGISG